MQYPEPDDGAWLARVLRNRRMNQVPETENPATRLRFMHQRPVTGNSPRKTSYLWGVHFSVQGQRPSDSF